MEKRGWETNGDGGGRAWAYRAQEGEWWSLAGRGSVPTALEI